MPPQATRLASPPTSAANTGAFRAQKADKRDTPLPVVPKDTSVSSLARAVSPLGFAAPKLRRGFWRKLSGIVLALAFPVGLAGAWFWSLVHEPELPLPFQIMVNHAVAERPQRGAALEITPLKVPLQDAAPVAGLSRDPRLIENSIHGPVPRASSEGLKPRQVYARPFTDTTKRPRIALIVTGLGLGLAVTDKAIAHLPPAVGLAFSPYGQDLVRQVQAARQDNRELLLQIPMEPYDFPANDAGPAMLAADAPPDANQDRLLWSLARMTGYVGLTNLQGGRFRDSPAMARLAEQVERRGLFFIDDGVGRTKRDPKGDPKGDSKGDSWPRASLFIDPSALDAGLSELERIAQERGSAIGMIGVTPAMIDRVAAWAQTLEARGLILVPITAALDPSSAQ
jgi:polysaccharide deacetylase 2 family uncharacterized protein YibQ